MNEGGTARAVIGADEVVQSDQPTADDSDIVLVDTRGRQITPLPTRMTVAEALEDSLGPRR